MDEKGSDEDGDLCSLFEVSESWMDTLGLADRTDSGVLGQAHKGAGITAHAACRT